MIEGFLGGSKFSIGGFFGLEIYQIFFWWLNLSKDFWGLIQNNLKYWWYCPRIAVA